MKKTLKPIIDIYMSSYMDAKLLAHEIHHYLDGIEFEMPCREIWENDNAFIECVLPTKKYRIFKGEK